MRKFDTGFLIVLAICFLAAWPFLSHASLPLGTDAELHVYRLAELQRMWAGGDIYPRWAANFYYGYGYPIFNFYAPLTYYIGLVFNLLPNLDPVGSVKAVFVLGIFCAGFGMYGFMRDNYGRTAALIAVASYVLSPYLLYIDPHARGVLPETFSLGIFPMALWALDRLLKRTTPLNFLATTLLLAAIILTHNLMAFVFGTFLFGYFLWRIIAATIQVTRGIQGDRSASIGYGSLAFLSAVLITSFFWLPMAWEQGAIRIGSVIEAGSHYDFRNHFLTLSELFGTSTRLDWGATEPDYRLNVGILQWLFGLLGGIVAVVWGKKRAQTGFFLVMFVIIVFFMLPISEFAWEILPLLSFLQFPWRLLGLANGLLAIVGGAAFSRLDEQTTESGQTIILTSSLLLFIFIALPLTQIAPYPDFGATDPWTIMVQEIQGRWAGTTSTDDFVPATVDVIPRPTEQLMADYQFAGGTDHVNRAALAADVAVSADLITPTYYLYHTDSANEFVLRLFIFHFPGWQATIDGNPVDIELGLPEGFITITVPEGQHTVALRFQNTPVRTVAWIMSAGGAIIMLLGVSRLQLVNREEAQAEDVFTRWLIVPLIAVCVLISFHLFVLEPTGILHFDSGGSCATGECVSAEPAQEQTVVRFGDKIALIGYDAPAIVKPGDTVEITLYWQPLQPLEENYRVFVHLLSDQPAVVTQSDKLNPGDFPTRRWPLDQYVRDRHTIKVPAALAPGKYEITVGLPYGSAENSARLQPEGLTTEWFVLRSFTVEP